MRGKKDGKNGCESKTGVKSGMDPSSSTGICELEEQKQ